MRLSKAALVAVLLTLAASGGCGDAPAPASTGSSTPSAPAAVQSTPANQAIVLDAANWQREHWSAGGTKPRLTYLMFGDFAGEPQISQSKHRSAGVPRGVELALLSRETDGEEIEKLLAGALGERLRAGAPELVDVVADSSTCLLIRGEVEDAKDLAYLRDTVGLIQALFEQGGRALCDAEAWLWLGAETWRREYFDHGESRPTRHVQILLTPESTEQRAWFRTRGMRKFGRPDLSVHCVPQDHASAVIEMLNRFVVMHAKGANVPEGQAVNMEGLPPGGTCRHGGEASDPEFDNVHIEIVWPPGSAIGCP